MRLTFNEVENGVKKAAIGAGWDFGAADDLGRAAAVCCSNGDDGLGTALGFLEGGQAGFDRLIAAFDLVGAGVESEMWLDDVRAPDLLKGLAQVAGADQGCGFILAFEGSCARIQRKSETDNITIAAVDVSSKSWHSVQVLAAKMLVPASEKSRLGAG